MDWRSKYVDISSCMLFESIGDSEADSVANGNEDDDTGGYCLEETATGLAEEDAFSCSSGNEFYKDCDHHTADAGDACVRVAAAYPDAENLKEVEDWGECLSQVWCDEYEEEDEDAVDQVRIGSDAAGGAAERYKGGKDDAKEVLKRKNPNLGWDWEAGELEGGGEGSEAGQRSKKLQVCAAELKSNQKDKDRHFWETCLAS